MTLFFVFQRKVRLDISCELSIMKCQGLFCLKNNKFRIPSVQFCLVFYGLALDGLSAKGLGFFYAPVLIL